MRRSTPRNLIAFCLAVSMMVPMPVAASSHREAPIVALDRAADITDFYAFVSYDNPNKVTLILCVDPLLEPSNGPNYFPFDPNILYAIRIDNNHDGLEDVRFEFRFKTEVRLPQVFTGFVGAGNGIPAPANSPAPVTPGTPIVPPAITALDGPGSEGLSLRQTYTVSVVRNGVHTDLGAGTPLFTVPSNVGPRTMPNYSGLADQGIFTLASGVKVFAGTTDDPFYIDLGAAFDTFNFRPSAFQTGIPGVLGEAQEADDSGLYAPDDVSGYNVNTIAIEVPITMLTSDAQLHAADDPKATIGTWGTTSRRKIQIRRDNKSDVFASDWKQIQRMGNPLINELIIGTGFKDKWSVSRPADDKQFANFALDPLLARVLNAAYGGAVTIPTPPRTDLLPLVLYVSPVAAAGTPTGPIADLLRLNTGVGPTGASSRKRIGLLAGDAAGFPNGRRVSDDVVDIAARSVVGVLNPAFNIFPNNRIGDGVNTNDVPFRESFPFVGYAHSGRDSRHIDPNEQGCRQGICPIN